MEPENHPEMTGKFMYRNQTSNLHVSLPNVSFHGCTSLSLLKKPCLFEVLLSLNQLLCLTERKWKKQQEGKKEERRGWERRGWERKKRKKGTEGNRKEKEKNWKGRKRKATAKQKSNKLLPILKTFWIIQNKNCWSKNKNCPKTPICGGNNHHTFPTWVVLRSWNMTNHVWGRGLSSYHIKHITSCKTSWKMKGNSGKSWCHEPVFGTTLPFASPAFCRSRSPSLHLKTFSHRLGPHEEVRPHRIFWRLCLSAPINVKVASKTICIM